MAGVVGLLLAAGQGRRFGSDKLLHPLADGTPMAVASARALKAACPHSLAALRPEQSVLADLLRAEGLEVRLCAAASQGMGHTLAAGVAASSEAPGWLVALADMPFVQPETHARVRDALAAGATLAAPFVEGQRGHPVGFAACWRDELMGLKGDEGARALLRRAAASLLHVTSDDPGALRDVDRPADLLFSVR